MPEVIMPKMGDAMTEGKVLRWMKQPGDAVKKGEPIAEIETDKVNVDIEAEWDGVLVQVLVGAGGVADVGAPIAVIARPGESPVRPAPRTAPAAPVQAPATPSGGRVDAGRASPLARRLAEQHGIPLSAIRGSGPEGRVTKEDVDAAIAAHAKAAPASPAAGAGAPATPSTPPAPAAGAGGGPLTRIPQTPARGATR